MNPNDPDFQAALAQMRGLDPDTRKRIFTTLKRERTKEIEAIKQQALDLPNAHWSKSHLLRRIPNPTREAYEQKIYIPEFTFLGVSNQPDFGDILLTFYPGEWTVELKSLKQYKDAFRDALASYERLANVVYDDLMEVYAPSRLRIMMRLRPRGGISSVLTIDSDWKARGGSERFSDWQSNTDRFGFETHHAVPVI